MVKIICAFAVASLTLYAWALAAAAPSPASSGAPTLATTNDRLDVGEGAAACSHYAWPYYDSACLYDARRSVCEGRKVRLVLIDRLPRRKESAN